MSTDSLQRLRALQAVPTQELQELLSFGAASTLARGEVVFEAGAPLVHAALLINGRLVAELERGGTTRQVGEIWPGEIVGEAALFDRGGTRSARVRASMDSELLYLSSELLAKARGTRALCAMQAHLIAVLAKRIQGTNLQLRKAWQEQRAQEASAKQPTTSPTSPQTLMQRLNALFGSS